MRAHRAERRVTHNDPALIEKLRRHATPGRGEVVNTTKIVRENPVVIEHERVVDDPPRVIERRRYVGETPAVPAPRSGLARTEADVVTSKHRPSHKAATPRTIRAEAEVTILGPDRMNIRLFRKRGGDAKAQAN
jgi:hypothetical protein